PTLVRKGFMIVGFLLCAVFMYAADLATSRTGCVAMLTAACAALGLYSSNAWAVTQTLAGPLAAGRWSGIQNAIGNMGGVVSPALSGWIIKETGSYSNAFTVSVGMLVFGAFTYIVLVGRVAPLEWNTPRPSEAA